MSWEGSWEGVELGRISSQLNRINRNLEKFLKRTEYAVPVVQMPLLDPPTPASTPIVTTVGLPSVEGFGLSTSFCSWCMGDILSHEDYVRCQHATLCSACAPCDECGDA
jgi:hypothetical protein